MTHKYQSPTHRNKVNLDLYRIENKTTTKNSLWKLKSMLLSSKRKKHKHISICQNIDNFIIYCTFYERTFRSPSIIIDASYSFVFNMYLFRRVLARRSLDDQTNGQQSKKKSLLETRIINYK